MKVEKNGKKSKLHDKTYWRVEEAAEKCGVSFSKLLEYGESGDWDLTFTYNGDLYRNVDVYGDAHDPESKYWIGSKLETTVVWPIDKSYIGELRSSGVADVRWSTFSDQEWRISKGESGLLHYRGLSWR